MVMKDPLAKLFGSAGRLKIMRLFMAQDEACLTQTEVQSQTKTVKTTVSKELKLLHQVGFLKKTKCKIEVVKKLKTKDKIVYKHVPGFALNKEFEYLQALRILLTQVSEEQKESLVKRVRRAGRIKMLVAGGVFMQCDKCRVDVLVVGDAIKQRTLENAIRATEAELGHGLRYAVFSTNEFRYRVDMRDKLICDIFDEPHTKLIDRLNLV